MCSDVDLTIPQSDGTVIEVNQAVDCNSTTCIRSTAYVDPNED